MFGCHRTCFACAINDYFWSQAWRFDIHYRRNDADAAKRRRLVAAASVCDTSDLLLIHAGRTRLFDVIANLGPISNGRPVIKRADKHSLPASPDHRSSTVYYFRAMPECFVQLWWLQWWAASKRPQYPGNFTVVQLQSASNGWSAGWRHVWIFHDVSGLVG